MIRSVTWCRDGNKIGSFTVFGGFEFLRRLHTLRRLNSSTKGQNDASFVSFIFLVFEIRSISIIIFCLWMHLNIHRSAFLSSWIGSEVVQILSFFLTLRRWQYAIDLLSHLKDENRSNMLPLSIFETRHDNFFMPGTSFGLSWFWLGELRHPEPSMIGFLKIRVDIVYVIECRLYCLLNIYDAIIHFCMCFEFLWLDLLERFSRLQDTFLAIQVQYSSQTKIVFCLIWIWWMFELLSRIVKV